MSTVLVDKWIGHDDALCRDADLVEPLTEAERAAAFEDFYWLRLDAEAELFGGAR